MIYLKILMLTSGAIQGHGDEQYLYVSNDVNEIK